MTKSYLLLVFMYPLIIFFSSLLWALDAPFRQPLLVAGLGVGFVALLEHLFNTGASLPALWQNRASLKNITPKQWAGFFYIGAGASAFAAILFVKGAVSMNYNFTVVALLQKFQPLFAILLSYFFLKEKITGKFWLYAVPALFGGYLVSFGLSNPFVLLQTAKIASFVGPFLAVLAAILWAGGTVVGRGLLNNLDFKLVTALRFLFGLLFLVFYVWFFEKFQFSQMGSFEWRNVFIIAMLTGFFALSLYYYGLKKTKASVATLMELGYPVALTIINWKFLHIALSPWQIAGAVLLVVSVVAMALVGQKKAPEVR